jgi:hypothetical protein
MIGLKGIGVGLAMVALTAGDAAAADPFVPRHGVIIEPGDVSPLRTRQGTLLGPTLPGPPERPWPAPGDPALDHELSRLESRAVAAPERELPAAQLERDLDVAGQRVRGLATEQPQSGAVPVYQHRLDWIDRLQRSAASRLREGGNADR